MPEAPVSLDFSNRIADARETPSGLESRWLLGATVAALTGRESARLSVGRYALLGELGRGGQGTVWEAEDARIRRRVALKFVQKEGLRVDSAWLRQEARAMARVEHENIAKVFDVGEHAGRPYVVMERLRGQDLASYASASTSDTALLEAYASAGQGLAAAHRAGVIHGDFKPSNAMVCDDGSVKVLDFGLARLGGRQTPGLRIGGTPAYMAPELLEGVLPSERSDQYAFCASLQAALKHRSSTQISAHVERALVRGLEPTPEARWRSMDALLAALQRRPGRRLVLVSAAAVALAAVPAALALLPSSSSAASSDCSNAEALGQEVWNPTAAATIATAFGDATTESTDPAAGVRTWTRVSARIDEHVEAWERDYAGHCNVDADPRRACLRNQLQSLDALLGEWAQADARMVELATQATEALPGPERCGQPDAAPSQEPLDRAIAAEIAEIEALEHAGKRAQATPRAEDLVRRASASAPSTYAGALMLSGDLLGNTDPKLASERLEASMLVSTSAGLDRQAARAATSLMYVQGMQLRNFAAAERSRRVATAALARFGGDARIANTLEDTRAGLALNRGNTEEAISILEGLLRRTGPNSLTPTLEASVLHNLALARLYLDKPQVPQAVAELQRVIELETAIHGARHPRLASTYNTLGMAWQRAEDWTRATDNWKTALRLAESSVSDDDQVIAVLLNNLGSASRSSGDLTQASAYLGRAYDIRVESLGTEHPDTGLVASNLGMLAETRGDLEAAVHWRAEAFAAFESALDPAHPMVSELRTILAATWVEWGNSLLEHQQPRLARDAYKRSIALDAPAVTPLARERLAALDTSNDG